MDSVLGGFHRPLQRRLTKLYTDTKSSVDFVVKEPIQQLENTETAILHRRLRIQKDRLVSWGLGWSDPSESPDIDESLSKAGLSDVVGSVMSTIQDILAESEPLWRSSKRAEDRNRSEMSSDAKIPIVVTWDRARFEDLIKDLTSSIDTLYDLSRMRQNSRNSSSLKQNYEGKFASAEEIRQFAPTRMETPPQIDPGCLLTDPRDIKSTIANSTLNGSFPVGLAGSRQIVYLSRLHSSANPWKLEGRPPIVPVLLEYAAYDPIYANTGIPPSMTRFEKLFRGLQMTPDSARPGFGVLNLVGYFEESAQAHFGLLYELPARFRSMSGSLGNQALAYTASFSDLLSSDTVEPPLELRYRLASNLATTVFDLHSKGIVHGNISASSVVFVEQQSPDTRDADALSKVNLRQPFLQSFELFPDSTPSQKPTEDVYGSDTLPYRHPLDPRVSSQTVLKHESRSLDVYALAMLLIEIAVWQPIGSIFPSQPGIPTDTTELYKQIAARCGTKYLSAVKSCLRAIDDEMNNHGRPELPLQKVYGRVVKALEGCCAIDDGVDQEDIVETPREDSLRTKEFSPYQSGEKSGVYASAPDLSLSSKSFDIKPRSIASMEKTSISELKQSVSDEVVPSPTKPKQRIFLSVKISQEHLDYWHTTLMPRINQALRGFYRKYPESVEISLESIGESVNKTKPTILVVCTSVGRVKSILKRSFEHDSETYGLQVCRGKILRSRKQPAKRSMADPEHIITGPVNPEYQEKPLNGASIGAFAEGRHLPPVSFGGLIMIDEKAYGLTVHHMLDDPDDVADDSQEQESPAPLRSSDTTHHEHSTPQDTEDTMEDEEFGYAISETGSDFSDGSVESDFSSDDDEEGGQQVGDIEGIPQGCGEGYAVTQPALDDVDESFFPDDISNRDEDHLESFALGEIYASSGIRRRIENGMTHEIDWAVFEFVEERLPEGNLIKDGVKHCKIDSPYPVKVAPWSKLHDLEVHCMARTTGLQTGRILPGMSIVKIFGRQTPSQSYQVSGKLGLPGDSGAWLIDNDEGRACGHVLAWSSRKRVAYICPMEILLSDIAETLGASTVCFPNAAVVPVDERAAASQKLTIEPDISTEEHQHVLEPESEDDEDFSYSTGNDSPSTGQNSLISALGEEVEPAPSPIPIRADRGTHMRSRSIPNQKLNLRYDIRPDDDDLMSTLEGMRVRDSSVPVVTS